MYTQMYTQMYTRMYTQMYTPTYTQMYTPTYTPNSGVHHSIAQIARSYHYTICLPFGRH